MARQKVLMGNWKMYKTVAEARAFAEEMGRHTASLKDAVEYAIFPPFTAIQTLRVILPTQIKLGAQNVHFEAQGAFTGEISAGMLAELSVSYVLVGHSERRHVFSESDEWVRQKVRAVAGAGIVPVLCVGEDLRQRELDHTSRVVERQTKSGLAELTNEQVAKSIIAYEPVWAIGSGLTPSVEDAEKVIAEIRQVVAAERGADVAEQVRILYGGSVKPGNIAGFTNQANIDGALVGGASLEPESFVQMAQAMAGNA